MFHQLNNIDTAFKHVRLFTIIVIICCTALSGAVTYYCVEKISRANERIYLLSGGQAYMAIAAHRKENIGVEARDHVKVFHEYFFTLSPDNMAIDATMKKAFYLADKSAKVAYDNMTEKGYYTNLISGNVSQEIVCDSVQINTAQYPFSFRYFGRQRIIRTTVIITRRLVTEGFLRNVDRTDNNPHGFLVENWRTLENIDLNVQKR